MDDREQNNVAQSQARIRQLNDHLRTTGQGGRVVMTQAMRQYCPDCLPDIIAAIREFDGFTPDNDPYGEHDFGQVTVDDETIFWKIDYYDVNLEFGSPDPADDTITCRVMTIMTASDL